jgi:hypothetical protein
MTAITVGFARRHREGLLYLAAVIGYVLFGAFVQKFVFNWIVGPVWALFFVYWIPSRLKKRRQQGSVS